VEVVGTNDLGNPLVMRGEHSTHTLFTRRYINERSGVLDEPNKVLHEGYPHEYCDDEFIQTAKARGCFAMALDSHVEHMHWAWKKGQIDPVYRAAMAKTSIGAALFKERRRMWA
jgi:hypothetical protein